MSGGRGRSRAAVVLAVAAAVATAAVAAVAPPAAGAAPAGAAAPAVVGPGGVPRAVPVTRCTGYDALPPHTVVPGDLHVVGYCVTRQVRVLGDVVVHASYSWGATGGRVHGDVVVRRGAAVALGSAHVDGGIVLEEAQSLQATGEVARSVRGKADQVVLRDVRVGGAVNVAVPERVVEQGLYVRRAEVGGWVNVHGGRVDVGQSYLHRGLTVSWARSTVVSEAVVLADVTVRHARGPVDVGHLAWVDDHESRAEWDPDLPPTRSVHGGDLLLLDNDGPVVVGDTDVAGDLECRGNRGAVRVEAVTVGGTRTGQCA
ncbi:hypothetical protein GC089_02980 [Cellulomonas sp. JZ18]|uniref:hypothetical protein n=1 Tax=Cellulomonas sp. JZ18 TaxID=2654191 RepID=UPI0012D3FA11|nr:hypothetical protein [Cellulomonas sp. JZ18]QGQ18407.1 hypothetical protein GC089_02980 [Cellulomonas sp. JZ18]